MSVWCSAMSETLPQFRCISCGYDLASLRAERTALLTCPECAYETDPYSQAAKRVEFRSKQGLTLLFLWFWLQAYLLGLFTGVMLLLSFVFYVFVMPASIPISIMTDRALGRTIKQQRRVVDFILVLAWVLGILLGVASVIGATHLF